MESYIGTLILFISLFYFTVSESIDVDDSSESFLSDLSELNEQQSSETIKSTIGLRTRQSNTEVCGISTSSSGIGNKIVGGSETNTTVHPWFAALAVRQNRGFAVSCGATLITSTHLITAAHCYGDSPVNPQLFLVVFNLSDRCNGRGKVAPVKAVIPHEQYKHGVEIPENDIAIIVLQYSVKNMPICLPSQDSYGGSSGIIIGYGSTKVRSTYPCKLQEAKVTVFTQKECEDSGIGQGLAKKAICAGIMKGGVDACDGDSGGPLIVNVNRKFELIGLTSYGEGCGRKNLPGVYTDLTERGQAAWIRKKLKENPHNSTQETSPAQQSQPAKPSKPIRPTPGGQIPHGHWQYISSQIHNNPSFLMNLLNHQMAADFAFD
ncbi:trypsin-like isoform X2 [Lycorma delicatula]|uniref:trypsin-like isoform X2 n=1 Tax=Lycorma delicatula TaxID=130591 RepID=UPI003F519E4A